MSEAREKYRRKLPTASRPASGRDMNFAHAQFVWLREVAFNPTLPPLAARVAIALTQFFNRETYVAYPAHHTLASELGVTERAIRATISKLIEQGHLGVVGHRSGGRRCTNRYRLLLKPPKGGTLVPGFGPETRNEDAVKAEKSCAKGGTSLPPNLCKEPTQEPSSTHSVKMNVKTWRSKASQRNGQPWRIFAWESFKSAPDGALDVDTQAAKFSASELNIGRLRTDAEWWACWDSWCRHAVNRARNPHGN